MGPHLGVIPGATRATTVTSENELDLVIQVNDEGRFLAPDVANNAGYLLSLQSLGNGNAPERMRQRETEVATSDQVQCWPYSEGV